MFSKLAALTLVVPFVSALTLNTPKNLSSGGPATITWTSASGDPGTFSLELLNTVFHNSFAIANNVNPGSGTISLQLPSVPPGDGYTIEAVAIGNITEVYATSGGFSVAAEGSASTTATSGGAGASSVSHASYTVPGTSSGFGVTNTNAPSATTVSGSPSAQTVASTGSGSSSASSATTSASSFNSASSLKINSVAIGLLSAIAGAAVFAL